MQLSCANLTNSDEFLRLASFIASKLKTEEKMTIGYLLRKGSVVSPIGEKYLDEIAKYKEKALL